MLNQSMATMLLVVALAGVATALPICLLRYLQEQRANRAFIQSMLGITMEVMAGQPDRLMMMNAMRLLSRMNPRTLGYDDPPLPRASIYNADDPYGTRWRLLTTARQKVGLR